MHQLIGFLLSFFYLFKLILFFKQNEVLVLSSQFHQSVCRKIGDRLIFQNCIIVLTNCHEPIPLPFVESVAKNFNVQVEYAKCNLSHAKDDGLETGIIFRWIISNWEKIKNRSISKIIFNHAHENSNHQRISLSKQLLLLFNYSSQYFCERDYGVLYPYYLETNLINGKSTLRGVNNINIIEILNNITKGTSFENINSTNSKNKWRSGQASQFFLSSSLITNNHSISDYIKMLDNMHKVVSNVDAIFNTIHYNVISANKFVAECFERGWNVLFTNKSYIDYYTPNTLGRLVIYRQ